MSEIRFDSYAVGVFSKDADGNRFLPPMYSSLDHTRALRIFNNVRNIRVFHRQLPGARFGLPVSEANLESLGEHFPNALLGDSGARHETNPIDTAL